MIRNIKGNNLLRKYQKSGTIPNSNNLPDDIYAIGNQIYQIETLEDGSQTYRQTAIINNDGTLTLTPEKLAEPLTPELKGEFTEVPTSKLLDDKISNREVNLPENTLPDVYTPPNDNYGVDKQTVYTDGDKHYIFEDNTMWEVDMDTQSSGYKTKIKGTNRTLSPSEKEETLDSFYELYGSGEEETPLKTVGNVLNKGIEKIDKSLRDKNPHRDDTYGPIKDKNKELREERKAARQKNQAVRRTGREMKKKFNILEDTERIDQNRLNQSIKADKKAKRASDQLEAQEQAGYEKAKRIKGRVERTADIDEFNEEKFNSEGELKLNKIESKQKIKTLKGKNRLNKKDNKWKKREKRELEKNRKLEEKALKLEEALEEKRHGGLVKHQNGSFINVPSGSFSKSEDQNPHIPSWINWGAPSKPGNYKRNFPDKSGYLLPSISTLTLDPNWKNHLIPSLIQRPKRVHPKLRGRDNPGKLANLQLKPKQSLPTKFNPKFKLNTPEGKVNHPVFGKYKKVSKPSGFDASFDYNPNSALSFTGKIDPNLMNKESNAAIQLGAKYKDLLDLGYNTDFEKSNLNLGLNNKYVNARFNTDFEGANQLALKAKYKELFGADFDTNFKENYNIGVKAGPLSGRFSNVDNIKNLDLSLKHKNIGLKVNTDLQGNEKFNISGKKEIGPVDLDAYYNLGRNSSNDKYSQDLGLKGNIKFSPKFSLSPSLVSDITNQKNKFGLSTKISPNKKFTFTPKFTINSDKTNPLWSAGTGVSWKPNKMLDMGADFSYGTYSDPKTKDIHTGFTGANIFLKAALNNAKAKPKKRWSKGGNLIKYQDGKHLIPGLPNNLVVGSKDWMEKVAQVENTPAAGRWPGTGDWNNDGVVTTKWGVPVKTKAEELEDAINYNKQYSAYDPYSLMRPSHKISDAANQAMTAYNLSLASQAPEKTPLFRTDYTPKLQYAPVDFKPATDQYAIGRRAIANNARGTGTLMGNLQQLNANILNKKIDIAKRAADKQLGFDRTYETAKEKIAKELRDEKRHQYFKDLEHESTKQNAMTEAVSKWNQQQQTKAGYIQAENSDVNKINSYVNQLSADYNVRLDENGMAYVVHNKTGKKDNHETMKLNQLRRKNLIDQRGQLFKALETEKDKGQIARYHTSINSLTAQLDEIGVYDGSKYMSKNTPYDGGTQSQTITPNQPQKKNKRGGNIKSKKTTNVLMDGGYTPRNKRQKKLRTKLY